MAIKEHITCDICGDDLERISPNVLHDRKPYFGVRRYVDEKPGEVQVESIANCELGQVKGADAHLCGYICLNAWWGNHISKPLNKELEDRGKETKVASGKTKEKGEKKDEKGKKQS